MRRSPYHLPNYDDPVEHLALPSIRGRVVPRGAKSVTIDFGPFALTVEVELDGKMLLVSVNGRRF